MFRTKNQFLIILFLMTGVLFSQSHLRDNLFGDYEKLLDQLQSDNAEILSPENYKNALKYYKKASADYEDKDESLVDIKKNLKKSQEFALRAKAVVALAKDTLSNALSARDEALAENAPIFAPDEWEKASDIFFDATENLEDNDIDDAIKYGARAYDLFKRTAIIAISNGIMGDARSQMYLASQEKAEQYCLNTYRNAQNLIAETEDILKKDPFAKQEAVKKAMQAAYEARHAQYLSRTVQALMKKDENWEKLILKFEQILATLGTQFHYDPEFDQGFDTSVKTLTSYISNLREEQNRLLSENAKLEDELSLLRESDATKSATLMQKEDFSRKLDKIKNLFTSDEAEVIYQGKSLIIRLVGLKFPSGKAIIQPEYFSLLTKVQRAIYEFPDKYLLIEGHTDATGNSFNNKTLSERRARAVTEYLIANLTLNPDQIEYYGMGEQKPIASNKTMEGRMRNRRIDITITLEDS